MIKHREFWNGRQGLDNIKPKRTGDNWESFNAVKLVEELCGRGCVNDIGCGTGRMSQAFAKRDYYGYDVNPAAIEIAREAFQCEFHVLKTYEDIEPSEILLLHSAGLHIPDGELRVLADLTDSRIVVGETMHGHTSVKPDPKPGLATHYSRSAEDYAGIFADFELTKTVRKTDTYSRKQFTYLVFDR